MQKVLEDKVAEELQIRKIKQELFLLEKVVESNILYLKIIN